MRIAKMVLLFITIILIMGCTSDNEKKSSHFEKGQTYFAQGQYKRAELEFCNAINPTTTLRLHNQVRATAFFYATDKRDDCGPESKRSFQVNIQKYVV